MNKNVVIIVPNPAKLRISPLGFYKYAKDFFDVAQSCKNATHYSPVPYYLYCRTIELVLKSFLLYLDRKIRQAQLRSKYGHDLIKTLNAVEKLLASKLLNNDERKTLEKANNYYYKKGFEYFKVIDAMHGYRDLPDLFQLKEVAQKLLKHPISKSFKI